MAKKKLKGKLKPKIVKVPLRPHAVVRVIVPKDHVPLVATNIEKGHVEIVPVKKDETWWDWLGSVFG